MVAQGGEVVVEFLKDVVVQFVLWRVEHGTARLPCPLLAQYSFHPHHSEVAIHKVKLEKELLICNTEEGREGEGAVLTMYPFSSCSPPKHTSLY